MTESTSIIRINRDETVTTSVGQFSLIQRNSGYADNDGRWLVHQYADLYWSPIGTLRQRRAGRFLGVFDTETEAREATAAAEAVPLDDKMVL